MLGLEVLAMMIRLFYFPFPEAEGPSGVRRGDTARSEATLQTTSMGAGTVRSLRGRQGQAETGTGRD